MKSRSPASAACCAALVVLSAPDLARAAAKILALTDAEPQYASKLCWAAADVLAVNQYYPSCPAPPTSTTPLPPPPPLFPTSQALETAWATWCQAGGMPPDFNSGAGTLSHYLYEICDKSIGTCNFWGNPALHGLSFKWGNQFPNAQSPDPEGLDWAAMTQRLPGLVPAAALPQVPSVPPPLRAAVHA